MTGTGTDCTLALSLLRTATRSYWRWPAHTRWKEDGRCVRTFRRCIERHDLHAVRLVCRAGRPESRPISRAWIRRRVPVDARPALVRFAAVGAAIGQRAVSATEAATRASRVLVISRSARSMTPEIETKLRQEFADHLVIDFDPDTDIENLVTPQARIVVAGGDGTVEFMLRRLADSKHPIGVLSLGTFNNFARALGLPENLDEAIATAKHGHARAMTLGRVNGQVFVEACAIGLFGETIALGGSAKDMEFGALVGRLKEVIPARGIHYDLTRHLERRGPA